MQDIVIIGAGGVGKEVALLIEQINKKEPTWNLIGFIDDNNVLHGTQINGYTVLGGIEYLNTMVSCVYAVCAIANYKVKKNIIGSLKNQNVYFANIIHPEIYISNTNLIGEGVIIYSGVIMTTDVKIGNHVIISPKCGIGHEAEIQDYVSLLWNVNVSGNVTIREGALIGSGVTIIQNKDIGRESIIGAGTVVIEDIPSRCTAVGVPAKVIKINT
jgi:sugar O-acyltransferase (sialic acid O-acetyltransferase NeuD family)